MPRGQGSIPWPERSRSSLAHQISQAGIALIREFEGCKLSAYVCPAGVLTIGVGSTGPHVKPGMTITQAEADALLLKDLVRFEAAVNNLAKINLTQGMYDALVSFAFNCGEGALAESTLLRRLNAGDDPCAVAKQEFPRWTNGGLAGLVRRRDAEVKLFCSDAKGASPSPAGTSGASTSGASGVKITATADTFLKKKAVSSSGLSDAEKHAIAKGKTYPDCWVVSTADGHTLYELPFGQGQWYAYDGHWSSGAATPSATGPVDLAVPFWPQTDNFTQASRTCNSSSCAMVLEFFRPDAVVNDDQYLKKLIDGGYGDTTDHGAQGRLLADYGLKSTWHTNLSLAALEKEIRAGRPVVCGILHRGSESAPTGGHMVVCRGVTSSGDFRMNDPYGSCNDGYTGDVQNGNNVIYSRKMMAARWTPDGPNSGWGRTFQP